MGISRNRRRSSDSGERPARYHSKSKRSVEEEDRLIAEYLAKKAAKKALRVAKKTQTDSFVWRKKIERDVCQGRVPLDNSYFAVKDKKERMAEIEKVQRRREERARQKAQRGDGVTSKRTSPSRVPAEAVDGEENSNIGHGSGAESMEDEEREEEAGSFSPQVFHGDENEKVTEAEKDMAIQERKRLAVLEQQNRSDPLELAYSSWDEKYRPRKPKYENKVHTAYQWNKYNRTHYDHDNPPPKAVVGYQFNIFYPDLIDRTKTPAYKIENDEDVEYKNSDTCIIRFHAGPPYEDIAFRVVNREWE